MKSHSEVCGEWCVQLQGCAFSRLSRNKWLRCLFACVLGYGTSAGIPALLAEFWIHGAAFNCSASDPSAPVTAHHPPGTSPEPESSRTSQPAFQGADPSWDTAQHDHNHGESKWREGMRRFSANLRPCVWMCASVSPAKLKCISFYHLWEISNPHRLIFSLLLMSWAASFLSNNKEFTDFVGELDLHRLLRLFSQRLGLVDSMVFENYRSLALC